METRSRKRAEASTSPSSSGPNTRAAKRSRTTSATPVTSLITTRSRAAAAAQSAKVMEPTPEPSTVSASNTRARRGKNPMADKDSNSKENPNLDKGKQKELDIRPRETARSLGLNVDSHDEDNESEGGGVLPHNLTSASSALQGLLRKLGAGLDDLLPSSAIGSGSSSHQSGRLKKILSGLRADGEEGKQVEALTQLCEMLSIGTEESLSTFSVESFVPVLVGLLNHENNADIMILAARAITHLVDVLPSSCAAVAHYGAVSCFVAKLLTIEYMDLAEQSLQALKKISQEHPTACLRAGALMAVLSYIDFFSTGVQRVALSTAANICKKLPSDAADFVMEAVPLLTNILQYQDAMLLEHASVCLTRIAEAFASSTEKLDDLCNHGLVTQAASLISSSNAGSGQSLSTSTYTGLIRLLSTCASGSDLGAKSLLLLGISGILKGILSCSGSLSSMSVSPALSRPPEQIFEIVNLANELLPPLPEGMISLPASSSMFVKGPLPRKGPVVNSGKKEDSNGNMNEVSDREKLLEEQPELLQQFGVDLLPVLVQIYGSSVSGPVRHKCLSVISKLMYFSPAEVIQSLNNNTNISSFLAGVLAWKDPQVLEPALNLADILMGKLPGTFSKMFVREGLVHAVDALILSGSSGTLQPSSLEKENDSIAGSSTRSRRNRRRSGNSSSDMNPDDDSNIPALSNVVPPNLTETTKLSSLRAMVSARAKAFKDKHFPPSLDGSEAGVTDDLIRLKNLCTKLNLVTGEAKAKSMGKAKLSSIISFDECSSKDEQMIEVVSEMLRELSREDGMSTFEFIGSGVVSSLLGYFTCGCFSKERVSEESLSRLRQQAIRRYKSFISISLPPNVDGWSEIPMSVLVKRLQDALSSLERFPLVLSHPSRASSGTARLSSGLSALSQPIKLRLCRAQGEKTLRDYSSNIVLIDPLASLAAVENFLWSRVQRNESSCQKPLISDSGATPAATVTSSPSASTTPATATRRHSTRSRTSIDSTETTKKELSLGKSSSLSKAKGKAVLKQALGEGSGPQTRNAVRRRAAVDKDNEMKAVDGDTNSEEDELDMSPVDMDDALVIEEDISDDDDDEDDDEDDDDVEDDDVLRDDALPYWLANSVHDVKFGDSTEDGAAAAVAPNDDQKAPASGSGNVFTTGRGSGTSELRTGTSFGSRGGPMSFAAAAMAGLTSGNNARGIRGLRDRQGRSLSDPPKLIFTAGGRQLSRHFTIYQAVHRQFAMDDENGDDRFGGSDNMTSDGSRLHGDIFTITYQKADGQAERSGVAASTPPSRSAKAGSPGGSLSSDASARHLSLLDSIVQGCLPCDMERTNPTYEILALLRVLEGLNQLAPRLRVEAVIDRFSEGKIASLDELVNVAVKVPPDDFINDKLTPKLARQFQDVLALFSGSLPSWCYQLTKACPFLFPFEIRRQYFYSTAFGLSRALNRLQQQQGADGQGSTNEMGIRVGRLRRQKVRVARNRILDSAAKVMEMYCNQKAVLEVEYFGEVGTGLGPTLEFYTLLSHDLQKVGLGMWRSNSSVGEDRGQETVGFSFSEGDKDILYAPLGLFPRPWPPGADSSNGSQFSKAIEYFRLLGRVMAKALQDGRLLDLPLSAAFYKLLLHQELDLHDIISFDAELGTTLQELHALVRRKQYLESKGIYNEGELRFRGASIEDLCLDFSVPGYPTYILKPGDDVNVDMSNLEEYVSLVVDATVGSGIMRQMEAFRSGFNQVFDISTLQIFSPNELDYLVCGRRELWQADSLAAHIKFDHGYTAKSPPIVNLLEIMCEFTPEQQRAFCQFVTGAPRLPPGGLAVLNPKLTIVRKHSSSTSNVANNGSGPSEPTADDDLPSVMTCANYLKLPPYSSKEIMYNKLLYAVSEGQGSFDLS